VRERLPPGLAQIDDAEPAMTQRHTFSHVGAMVVRATVHQTRLHALDQTLIAPIESTNAAHDAPFNPLLPSGLYRRTVAVLACDGSADSTASNTSSTRRAACGQPKRRARSRPAARICRRSGSEPVTSSNAWIRSSSR